MLALLYCFVPIVLTRHIHSSATTAAAAVPLVSTGLKNLGNTCYLNAQLQCAFHIPLVRQRVSWSPPPVEEIVMEEDEEDRAPSVDEESNNDEDSTTATNTKDSTEGENSAPLDEEESSKVDDSSEQIPTPKISTKPDSVALQSLRDVFEDMARCATQMSSIPAAPRSLCLRLGIPVMEQQDSQEFWKLLLPALERQCISDLYTGSFEDYIEALDGSGRVKRREEVFLDLSLDIASSSSVVDSLNKTFGDPELLSVADGNGWRPEKGADKVDAHKGSKLIVQGLPNILQLHLKRFNYDWQTGVMSKLNNRFAFPDVLDLSSICSGNDEGSDDQDGVFDLQSIVIHMGEYGVGHYYAYVRPDVQSDVWYRFNDHIVEEVTYQDVIEDAYGGRNVKRKAVSAEGGFGFIQRIRSVVFGNRGASYGFGGSTSNAYVLQYVRRRDIPTLYPGSES